VEGSIGDPKRFGHHKNAFGFLRLAFASLVIAAHVPEVVDGNARRELLTRIFGSMSFGELAVEGFFIISGFLIASSYLNSSSIRSYLVKRVGRIYPAFLVASMLCILVVAPLGGADLRAMPWAFSKRQSGMR
jgi:peptidoglycan/LPS O-acetylase OafA/YrhL